VHIREPNCLPHTSAGGGCCCCMVPWQKQPMSVPAYPSGPGPCPSGHPVPPAHARAPSTHARTRGERNSRRAPTPAGAASWPPAPAARPIHPGPADVSGAKIQSFRNEPDHVAVARNCPPDNLLAARLVLFRFARKLAHLALSRAAGSQRPPTRRIGPDAPCERRYSPKGYSL